MTAAEKTYHHGDLRNALIIAAAELIEESGSLNFAMADAARKAGVSSAAPYRHFKDKEALLEAVSQLGFFALGCSARLVKDTAPEGSIEALIALGQNYVRFVVEKAPFYDLMWGDLGARAMHDENFDKKASGFFVLAEAVEAYMKAQGVKNAEVLDVALKLWAMVHGLSGISMSGKLPHLHPDADVPSILDAATRTYMTGLVAEG